MMVLESFFLDKAQCCTYVGIKFIVVIPSPLSGTNSVRVIFPQILTKLITFSRSTENNDFSYFCLVSGTSSLHNFQEVDIISFPAHIFVRRLVPPPQVLLQSSQSPTCHLYSEGHGSMLHSCHAAGAGSMR